MAFKKGLDIKEFINTSLGSNYNMDINSSFIIIITIVVIKIIFMNYPFENLADFFVFRLKKIKLQILFPQFKVVELISLIQHYNYYS